MRSMPRVKGGKVLKAASRKHHARATRAQNILVTPQGFW